jgi:hypothetical protein
MANLLSIRSGTMTLAEVIARQGRNPTGLSMLGFSIYWVLFKSFA